MNPSPPHHKSRLLVWYGELVSRRSLRRRGLFLLAAPVLWLAALLVIPSILLLGLAFAQRSPYGEITWRFTTENFRRLAGFGLMSWSPDTLLILWRSVVVAFVTTALSVLLAYPLGFFIASRPARTRTLWLVLIIVPICTNLVIRTYAWMLILGNQAPPARLAHALGLIGPDEALFPGPFAVYLGMVTSYLPFTVLPIYTNIERMDWSIVESAQDLYASRWRIFTHAILPQTLPGLTVALILTFIPALGSFVVPDLLGGSKFMLLGNLIQQEFGPSRDLPFGAAVSFGLMLLTLAGLFALRRSGAKESSLV